MRPLARGALWAFLCALSCVMGDRLGRHLANSCAIPDREKDRP